MSLSQAAEEAEVVGEEVRAALHPALRSARQAALAARGRA